MLNKSLDAILGDFNPHLESGAESIKTGGPVTVWLPKNYKQRYERLQEQSKKRFGKKVRELIQAAIDRCDVEAAEAS